MTAAVPVVLVGAGGLGREVLAAVRAGGVPPRSAVEGFVDDRPETWGSSVDGVPVLGAVRSLLDGTLAGLQTVICTGRPGNTTSRVTIDRALRDAGVPFATVVHPTSSIAVGTHVGEGSVLLAHVVATAPITIGRHVVVMPQVVFTHDDEIGDFTTFGAGVRLAGGVRVEPGAYVGSGSLVRENLTIGAGSLVGMGAVVTRDVPPNEVWVGNPARFLRTASEPLTSSGRPADDNTPPTKAP